ncbi:hypothetical protein L6164_017342 [Bauhinia variegata]|uniref:Uncharacterized protein n=1 Tax=Bauhinia variegata TaxID=167791 RepID=A0ACB9N963_BAUVA|nr:hypothetical protein L6164_017342 [Bauhinia variegata]
MTVQANDQNLKPSPCNIFDPKSQSEQISGSNLALLYIALFCSAFGISGLRATLPAQGADQFDEKNPKDARQLSSFFNILMFAMCIGGAVSLTVIVGIQTKKGWDWGFGLSLPLFGLLYSVPLGYHSTEFMFME